MTDEQRPVTPEARAKRGAGGVPVTLSDGRVWLLAHAPTAEAMDALRDRIYEDMVRERSVLVRDARAAAWALLRANYDLSPAEALGLVATADPEAVTSAAVEALLGDDTGHTRTYSKWARSALAANGVDPAKVPAGLIPDVLAQLVSTGRAVPAEQFIPVAAYQQAKAQVLAQAEW